MFLTWRELVLPMEKMFYVEKMFLCGENVFTWLKLFLHGVRLNNLDLDLSRSLMVKCDGGIGLPIHDYLLV